MDKKKYFKQQKGFSIIEVTFVIAIFLLIGLAVAGFQFNIFSFNSFLSEGLTLQDEARNVMRSLIKEARSLSQSSTGSYAIEEANGTSLIFYSNIDEDGFKERIRYFLDGDILKKGVIKPSGQPLVYDADDEVISEVTHYIVNGAVPIFTYYDTNYDGTTDPLAEPVDIISVRVVKVNILIDKDTINPPTAINVTTQVSMRNLKDNL